MPSSQKYPVSGAPHVAYVLLWYPLFTQPFIFREVEGLRRHLPLTVYSLYGLNVRQCSRAMKDVASQTRTHGVRALPAVLAALLAQAVRSPRRLWRLFRHCLWRRWPSWEILGENLWAFCMGVLLARVFREEGMDIIYAPWPRGTATAALVASELSGIPFATSARGDNLEPADPDLEEKLRAACFIRANNRADMQRIEALPHARAKGKTFLVYNGLTLPHPAPEELAPLPMQTPLRLFAIGRFDVTKGFDVLLLACNILRQRGLDFHLTLAGGGGTALGLGALEKKLVQMRHELGLEQHVSMPGLVSHDELPHLLRQQDIFLAPCVVDAASGKRDGIPNTVIEALAFGLPVVASAINALPEVVLHEETGLLVEPGNAQALADAVMRLAQEPALARRLGAAAARLAQSMFSAEQNIAQLAGLLRTADANIRNGNVLCVE